MRTANSFERQVKPFQAPTNNKGTNKQPTEQQQELPSQSLSLCLPLCQSWRVGFVSPHGFSSTLRPINASQGLTWLREDGGYWYLGRPRMDHWGLSLSLTLGFFISHFSSSIWYYSSLWLLLKFFNFMIPLQPVSRSVPRSLSNLNLDCLLEAEQVQVEVRRLFMMFLSSEFLKY